MKKPWVAVLFCFGMGWGTSCGSDHKPKPAPTVDEVRDWRDEVVYHLITDRFANGDHTNDADIDPSCATCYHGGDWRGIIEHLDYLQALGVTTIWISPVVANADSPLGGTAYHAYWPRALDQTNDRFGERSDLRELLDACHQRDLKVIVDVVVNHFGPVAFYDINLNGQMEAAGSPATPGNEFAPPFAASGVGNESGTGPASLVFFVDGQGNIPVSPASFQNTEWFNRRGQITDWNDPVQALTGDFKGGLRDLDTAQPVVRTALSETTVDWLTDFSFDGLRLDAAKHVDDALWLELLPDARSAFNSRYRDGAGLMLVAEVFDGNTYNLAPFTASPRFDSVLNFAAKYQVFDDVFKFGGATSRLADFFSEKENNFPGVPHSDGLLAPPNRVLFNFIDNHDVPRFLHNESDPALLRCALAFLLTSDGVPVIYYGTEQEFAGGEDPANRESLAVSNYRTDGETFAWISRLNEIRASHPALRRGDTRFVFTTTHTNNEVDAGMVAYERFTATERVLVVINTHRSHNGQTTSQGNAMKVGFPPGTELVDLLSSATPPSLVVEPDGSLPVSAPPLSASVWVVAP